MRKTIGLSLVVLSFTGVVCGQDNPPPKVGTSQSVIMATEGGPSGASSNFSIMTADSNGGMNVMSFSPGEGLVMGSSGMSGDPFSMLTAPEIQAELDVVGDQREQIMKLQQDYSAKIREQIEAMRQNNFAPEKAKDIRETISELQARQRQDIDDLLLPHQRTRLNQLAIQAKMKTGGAVNALNDKKVMEEIGINEEQLEALRTKAKELAKELEEKIAKLREETQQTLLGELSRDQREKLEKMIGDKFEFPKPKPMEPRRINKQTTEKDNSRESDKD